ncbi:MAG: hypothetical protein K2Q01_05350 [Rickettsiales bacterium]|nr:hypothetical protein [Rickettsiales bacterium]
MELALTGLLIFIVVTFLVSRTQAATQKEDPSVREILKSIYDIIHEEKTQAKNDSHDQDLR